MDLQQKIKIVAIYLRKSRDEGEAEDVLVKHRDTLVSYATNQNWKYVLYEEVESGDKIAYRPKVQKLLDNVEAGFYDGVLVMDIDRLGRGDLYDQAIINKAFKESNTYIITPQKIYNPHNELDDVTMNMQGLFARMEYNQIKKRLIQGKRYGAEKGTWVNGKPPFPYYYDRTKEPSQRVQVDNEKAKIYRMIIEMYLLKGYSTQEISVWLNRNKIPSPGGSTWHNNAIYRVLSDEFHLGYIINNKVKGSGHRKKGGKVTKLPPSEWTKVKGSHTPLKTEEEHEQILTKLAKNQMIPDRSKSGCFTLSGLLICKKCGHRMLFGRKKMAKTGKVYENCKCHYVYPGGTKCKQTGRKLDEAFFDALYQKIINIDDDYLAQLKKQNESIKQQKQLLETKKQELNKHEKALKRIEEAFEEGAYDVKDFKRRKTERKDKINIAKGEIQKLELLIRDSQKEVTLEEMQERIEQFKVSWNKNMSIKEKNKLIRSLVNKIYYDREGSQITLEIEYK